MSAGAHLWIRVMLGTALAAALLMFVAPERPRTCVSWPLSVALGAVSGVMLFGVAARRRPLLPRTESWRLLAGKLAFFGLWATNEEVVWRRVALGELLAVGLLPALAVSTAGFALLHRGRCFLHLGTGLAFGAVYVVTGALAASVTAHWIYNVLVDGLVQRARGPTP